MPLSLLNALECDGEASLSRHGRETEAVIRRYRVQQAEPMMLFWEYVFVT
jgi:hypothetical protein